MMWVIQPGCAIMLRPNQRPPQFDVSTIPALASAWNYSAERFQQIETAIGNHLPDCVACIAVSGSLARMEAHSHSDVDLIIVVDDRHRIVSDTRCCAVFSDVWDRIRVFGDLRPKPDGIFSVCARWSDLVDPSARGRIDESLATFGHRIQLLMDAQPVLLSDEFVELQIEILNWYSETRLTRMFNEPGPFHWLWQDVQRYWLSLKSRTYWLNADDPAKSLTLNVKLRSSRLMMVFAFLQTLQQSWHSNLPLSELISAIVLSLHHTPAERLFRHGEAIGSWDTIWKFLSSASRHPASQLTDDLRHALTHVEETARTMIESTCSNPHGRHGVM